MTMTDDAPAINPRALPREAGSAPFAEQNTGGATRDEFDVMSGLWDGEFRLGRSGMDSTMMAAWAKDRNRARLYKLMYWRKPDADDGTWGDICVSSNYPSDFMANIETGWTPLPQFGKFDHENPVTPWGGHWSVRNNPFRLFLIHPKAHTVISLRQALELGWHRVPRPGDRRVDLTKQPGWAALFAQWKGSDIECPTCGRKVLSEFDLDRHIRVVHTERAQTEALARTMLTAAQHQSGPMADALRGISEGLTGALQSLASRQERSDQMMLEFMRMQMGGKPPEDGPGLVMPVGSPISVPDAPAAPRPAGVAEDSTEVDDTEYEGEGFSIDPPDDAHGVTVDDPAVAQHERVAATLPTRPPAPPRPQRGPRAKKPQARRK